ncbi:Dabb family protein [Lipingzhangella sp. LS1_29]|uniref:Dabb family protein n=1 Tax=Lipingzhangella rawalii TaxID=2055835 RepID=A0ABU2H5G6_9ACTN|nr:Dabb family protein [Lipingzhangella rawalii]MDS1270551.1 Dabb family protein [Lipingzhangella rawalii]
MGIRHVALFRWLPDTTPEQVAEVERRLGELPGQIPELRAYAFGADVGVSTGNFDFAVVADVDDVDGFRAYRDHPEHQKVLGVISALLAERAAVQFPITR